MLAVANGIPVALARAPGSVPGRPTIYLSDNRRIAIGIIFVGAIACAGVIGIDSLVIIDAVTALRHRTRDVTRIRAVAARTIRLILAADARVVGVLTRGEAILRHPCGVLAGVIRILAVGTGIACAIRIDPITRASLANRRGACRTLWLELSGIAQAGSAFPSQHTSSSKASSLKFVGIWSA
jgi:hypothetical protein